MQAGQGIDEAGGQAPQASISQTSVYLLLPDLFQINPKGGQGLFAGIEQTQIDHIVAQGAADKELHGQIIQALGIGLSVTVLCFQHPFQHSVPKGITQGQVIVPFRAISGPFAQGESDVPDNVVF
jgi:hypothetical protein